MTGAAGEEGASGTGGGLTLESPSFPLKESVHIILMAIFLLEIDK